MPIRPPQKWVRLIGARLRYCREAQGRGQQEVVRAIGISKSQLGLWEKGACAPNLENACKLALFYGVTMDWLCGLSTDNRPEQVPEEKPQGEGQGREVDGPTLYQPTYGMPVGEVERGVDIPDADQCHNQQQGDGK